MPRNRMKNLLRKLHIGGSGAATPTISQRHPNPNPNPYPYPYPNDTCSSDDFNVVEEDFQMRLAMAISASHPHHNNADSDSDSDSDCAQIDAAKQMSLGYEASLTDATALLQFQSLRYWVGILLLFHFSYVSHLFGHSFINLNKNELCVL